MTKKMMSNQKKKELVIVYQALKALGGLAVTDSIRSLLNKSQLHNIPYRRNLKLLARTGYIKREHHVRVDNTLQNRWEIRKK